MKYQAHFNTAFYIFLFACALLHASHFLSFTYNSPIDFRNVYLGARCWLQGQNAYDDAVLKQTWQSVCEDEHIENTLPPGLPQNSLVYPPAAFPVYGLTALMPWKWAAIVNLLFSCAALLLIVWLIRNYFDLTRIPFILILLVACAFKGTFHALLVGQPTFLFLLTGLLSLYLIKRQHNYTAALLLGITLCKPTLALPFVIYLVVRRRYRVVAIAVLWQFVLLVVSLFVFTQTLALLNGFYHNINALMDMVYAQGNIYYMRTLTDAGVWVNYLFSNSYVLWKLLQNGILILLAYVLWNKPIKNDAHLFTAIAFVSLLLSYHLFYDVLLLLPFVGLVGASSPKYKTWAACLALPLFLPVNGVLDRTFAGTYFPFLYLHLPLVLVALGCWFIAYTRMNHK